MIEEHPIFESPLSQNQKLWRYIDFTKLIDLLNTQSLHFTRADFFDDIFEGSITKATSNLRARLFDTLIRAGEMNPMYTPEWMNESNKEQKKEMAINCWHMNDYESAAMWKLYLKSNEGIAIQSTFNRLRQSLQKTDIAILIGVVKYIDYDKDIFDSQNLLSCFIHKRLSFEHEKELRCVIWQPGFTNNGKVNLESGGMKVKVELQELIENVYVSPDSPLWFTELVQDVIKKFGFEIPVINSRLKDSPIF